MPQGTTEETVDGMSLAAGVIQVSRPLGRNWENGSLPRNAKSGRQRNGWQFTLSENWQMGGARMERTSDVDAEYGCTASENSGLRSNLP